MSTVSTPLTPLPITEAELLGRIDATPRVPLALLPTPLEEMPRLTEALGGPTVLVKRDDLTGLAFGGNKVRSLEFRMAEALASGADTIVAGLHVLSNSARQTAAAANRLGLDAALVLRGPPRKKLTANLRINYILGAMVVRARDAREQREAIDEWVSQLKAAGKRPFVLSDSPLFALSSALAYANATVELMGQLRSREIEPERVTMYITSTGKGQPGLELAVRALGLPARVVGCAVDRVRGGAAHIVAEGTNAAAAHLGLDLTVDAAQIDNRDRYVGEFYGEPSEYGIMAMDMAARSDGLLLDPVYTSKGFAALMDDAKRGLTGSGDVSVFFHTGGLPHLFDLEMEQEDSPEDEVQLDDGPRWVHEP